MKVAVPGFADVMPTWPHRSLSDDHDLFGRSYEEPARSVVLEAARMHELLLAQTPGVAYGMVWVPDKTTGVVIADREEGPIVRWVATQRSPEIDGFPAVEQVKVEYWLDPDDGRGLYHAVFTSPLVSLRDALVDLYDVMVSTAPEEPGIVRARPAAST